MQKNLGIIKNTFGKLGMIRLVKKSSLFIPNLLSLETKLLEIKVLVMLGSGLKLEIGITSFEFDFYPLKVKFGEGSMELAI